MREGVKKATHKKSTPGLRIYFTTTSTSLLHVTLVVMSQPVALFGLKVKPGDVHRIPMVFRDFKITNVSLGENVVGNKRVVVKVHHIPHYGHPAVEEEEIGDSDDDEDDDEEDSEEDAEEDDEDEDEDEDEEDEEEDSDDEDIRDALRAEKSYTERSFVLCTLIPGQREQATVDIAFTEDEDIGFSVVGDNEVDLLGNYTTPVGADQPPYSDEEEDSDFDDSEIDSDDIDGMDYDSDEYDSDEIDEDGLEAILAEEDSGLEDEDEEDEESDESKIEEIGAEPLTTKKSALKKRKAADEEPVEDVSMTAPVTDSEVAEAAAAEGIDVSKLTKAQRKRLNKKLKSATDAADDSVASTSSAPAVSKKESVKAAVVENGKAKTAAAETTAKDGKTVSTSRNS